MWKNGQIVTVCGKTCRVKSTPREYFSCNLCALTCDTAADCDPICFSKDRKLGDYQYLEEIPAKGKVLVK